MAKGVKKIKVVSGLYYPKMSVLGQRVTIKPDQWVQFGVGEWLPGTTDADKKKPLTWMRQNNSKKIIINQITSATGYKFLIGKQFCGSYQFYIEASLSGVRDPKNDTGIYVKGWCDPKIVSSKWSTQKNSKSIKNNKKAEYISYGHIVHLNLMTEGLNGNTLSIELWNQQSAKKDKLVHTYNNVQVIDGEVNVKMENTFAWMSYVDNIQNVEEFYVKVKDTASKQYIKDKLGDDLHAIYLNVKNKIATTNTNGAQNQTPTKVYKPDVNSVRLEPCKFEVIKITENETKDGQASNTTVKVFDNGNGVKLIKSAALQEHIQRTIFYKFDSTVIDKDGVAILNNVLKFLLEHKDSTMNLSGYACVIGKENYNRGLSQRRADVVKKFFADGGLDPRRIISVGKGEVDPTDDKMGRDNIKYKNEKDYENNRRVDISFVFNAHDAQTVNYEVTAPSVSTKKNLIIDITGFQTNECFRDSKGKHKKQALIVDVGQAIDKGDTVKTFTTPSFSYGVYSNLSRVNVYPIEYIWPSATNPNQFHLHVHSCRYFSNEKRTTVLIKAYPDIKWELALEFLVNVSNYKAANMPPGSVYAKHQEKSRQAGYNRMRMNETGKVPISIGVGLSAEWDAGREKRSFTNEFADKIKLVARMIATAVNIVQNAINYAQSAAKETAIPVGFNMRYPKFTVVGKWYLERVNERNTLSVIGEVGFGFKPLIGAEVVIDILGAAIAAASYGATGNPAAARIINKFRGGLEKLGASVTFTATFYGELEIMVDALKIDSINGINMQGKTTIGGKMGATIELSVSVEIGTVKGTKSKPIMTFKAAAKADSYFGGDIVLDSDSKGLFIQPILKFSGVVLSVEIEGEVGWWKSNFKVEEKAIKEETFYLEKKYLT
ncbi:OmpA family protein [Chryseobacterium sp. D764]|uniref:OmpA family protein n=1 Tax=unclassified Chryseobacterium TaxID=2593645 RepID=UPI0009848774|nr:MULTISPECIES: OmpA family protein [unclassified Chryseobacterium]QXU51200.1 OmpA family protein [Chryseobacterium sp. D764]